MIWISIPKIFLLAALPWTFMCMKKHFRKRKRKASFIDTVWVLLVGCMSCVKHASRKPSTL
ncbi:hypothetical protein MUK42_28444 [Musa troglodytarum]|uniref:Uncharacterized protein n=1 Tax=Musa troglodytarum TaxID=320322 RepID=A0A9E7K560_9LILI|nr:hypothetical protein MUK42_28444 [Musa troglodytarum]